MKMPEVSVIIPNYNHSAYLSQRIESVLGQTVRDLEVIILDDYSPDNSRDIIDNYAKRDSRIKKIYNEQNSGSTFKQWNKGFASANGKYIWIAESDDYADESFLEKLISFFEQDDQIGLAYSGSFTVDESSTVLDRGEVYLENIDPSLWKNDFVADGLHLLLTHMVKSNFIPNASAVLLRRSAVQEAGFADESKRLVGDWLYWSKILANNKIAYHAEPLNYFRKHTNNVRSSSSVSGIALLEFVDVVKQIKSYGSIDQTAYNDRLEFIIFSWFRSIIYSKIPLRIHRAIYRALNQLDSSTTRRIVKLFTSNRLSGLRMLVGDGLLLPWLRKLQNK